MNASLGLAAPTAAILCYHRVCDVGGRPTWNVTPRQFRRQMEHLLAAGNRPMALADFLVRPVREPPTATFMVTFDDGYAGVASHVLPILQDLKIPATVFLATAFVDAKRPFPFDDWSMRQTDEASWRPLSRSECERLLASQWVTLGSHTHTHADFRGTPDAFERDLEQSRAWFRRLWGIGDLPFAFPYGAPQHGFCRAEWRAAVRRMGFTCALSTAPGTVAVGSDPFRWGRIVVQGYENGSQLQIKMDSRYGQIREAWRRTTAILRPPCRVPHAPRQSAASQGLESSGHSADVPPATRPEPRPHA